MLFLRFTACANSACQEHDGPYIAKPHLLIMKKEAFKQLSSSVGVQWFGWKDFADLDILP